jgi:hypothetical protein
MERVVVGVFEDKGTAEHACGRLTQEGIPETDVVLRLLKQVSAAPTTTNLERETLSVDPFFWFVGDVRNDYARLIHNGETAVSVLAGSDARIDRAVEIMQWYRPVHIEVISRSVEGKVLRDLRDSPVPRG